MERKTFLKSAGLITGFGIIPKIGKSEAFNVHEQKQLKPRHIKSTEGDAINVLGDIQTHKLRGADTNNQFFEWYSDVAPGVGIPPHYHTNEEEIFRIMKGEVEFIVDGKMITAFPGDQIFAPKNVPHSWKIVGSDNAKMIVSTFPAGLEFMFDKLAALPPGPPDLEKVGAITQKYGVYFI